MILTKEQILQSQDLKTEIVEVPEWGGSVIVRIMTGTERDRFEQSIVTKKGEPANISNIRAKLCAATIVDESGNQIFTSADIESLGGKSGAALDKVFTVAQRLNGIGEKDVEDLAKNSTSSQSESSTSD